LNIDIIYHIGECDFSTASHRNYDCTPNKRMQRTGCAQRATWVPQNTS